MSTPNRTHLAAAVGMSLCAIALFASVALAGEVTQKGNLQVTVAGKLSPKTLPRTGTAPVAVTVGGKVSTTDQTEPPQLQKLVIEINRQGHIDPTGLPTCPIAKIETTNNGHALSACRASAGRHGPVLRHDHASRSSPLPDQGETVGLQWHGRPKACALRPHLSPTPFSTSFVITFEIKNGGHGNFGTILTSNLEKALGTQRNLTGIEMTLNRRYSYRGARRSYVSAGCPAPKGVRSVIYQLARTSFTFANAGTLTTTLNRTCGARG